jgi:hypothetical protein
MSSKNNVNPGQYKTRGSQRQGEDVVHDIQKQEFKQGSSPNQNQDKPQTMIPQGQPKGAAKDKKKTGQQTAKTSGR